MLRDKVKYKDNKNYGTKSSDRNRFGSVSKYCTDTYVNQQDAQNSVITLYFPLDALHVSDCISPSSGTTL